jgi:shikimate dehydrogenase|uniref:Shikimate dehydrogenase (NADP(+)) n=1 Tax=Desulfobacca acetoxidans TaxID=60893 RepID=A0A7C3Z196_9BACT
MTDSCHLINGATQVYGLLGRPVAHSRSPAMHNAAFRELGLNGVYVAFPVTDLAQAVAGLRGLNIRGASVTIPFKEEIIPLLDEIDPQAAGIGAVNTVVNREGRLVGHNTDWVGALAALAEKTAVAGKRVLILGAGGAARAIAFGLLQKGAQVGVTDLDRAKALALARQLWVEVIAPDHVEEYPAEVLINATPVGMEPERGRIPIDPNLLGRFQVVMDIVYQPLETRLLQEAQSRGCRVIDGLRMLIHQATEQFVLWTGRQAPLEVMAAAAYGAQG